MAKVIIDTEKVKKRFERSGNGAWPRLLQGLGLLGIVFYAVGPALFPQAELRQPELLPVYTLMMGLGELWKGDKRAEEDEEEN